MTNATQTARQQIAAEILDLVEDAKAATARGDNKAARFAAARANAMRDHLGEQKTTVILDQNGWAR